MMTKEKFNAAARMLIDNGIEADEAQTVLQALCYVILDEETEQFMSDDIVCCQNCMTSDCKYCEGWIHN